MHLVWMLTLLCGTLVWGPYVANTARMLFAKNICHVDLCHAQATLYK